MRPPNGVAGGLVLGEAQLAGGRGARAEGGLDVGTLERVVHFHTLFGRSGAFHSIPPCEEHHRSECTKSANAAA